MVKKLTKSKVNGLRAIKAQKTSQLDQSLLPKAAFSKNNKVAKNVSHATIATRKRNTNALSKPVKQPANTAAKMLNNMPDNTVSETLNRIKTIIGDGHPPRGPFIRSPGKVHNLTPPNSSIEKTYQEVLPSVIEKYNPYYRSETAKDGSNKDVSEVMDYLKRISKRQDVKRIFELNLTDSREQLLALLDDKNEQGVKGQNAIKNPLLKELVLNLAYMVKMAPPEGMSVVTLNDFIASDIKDKDSLFRKTYQTFCDIFKDNSKPQKEELTAAGTPAEEVAKYLEEAKQARQGKIVTLMDQFYVLGRKTMVSASNLADLNDALSDKLGEPGPDKTLTAIYEDGNKEGKKLAEGIAVLAKDVQSLLSNYHPNRQAVLTDPNKYHSDEDLSELRLSTLIKKITAEVKQQPIDETQSPLVGLLNEFSLPNGTSLALALAFGPDQMRKYAIQIISDGSMWEQLFDKNGVIKTQMAQDVLTKYHNVIYAEAENSVFGMDEASNMPNCPVRGSVLNMFTGNATDVLPKVNIKTPGGNLDIDMGIVRGSGSNAFCGGLTTDGSLEEMTKALVSKDRKKFVSALREVVDPKKTAVAEFAEEVLNIEKFVKSTLGFNAKEGDEILKTVFKKTREILPLKDIGTGANNDSRSTYTFNMVSNIFTASLSSKDLKERLDGHLEGWQEINGMKHADFLAKVNTLKDKHSQISTEDEAAKDAVASEIAMMITKRSFGSYYNAIEKMEKIELDRNGKLTDNGKQMAYEALAALALSQVTLQLQKGEDGKYKAEFDCPGVFIKIGDETIAINFKDKDQQQILKCLEEFRETGKCPDLEKYVKNSKNFFGGHDQLIDMINKSGQDIPRQRL